MKKARRLLSVLLASVLMFGMLMPLAQADPIEVDFGRTGSITITKYLLGRMSDASNIPHDGQELSSGLPPTTALLEGAQFKVVKMVPGVSGAAGATEYEGKWYVPDAGSDAYNTTLTTNASGIAAFTNLKVGIYYVEELPNIQVTDPTEPFFVSVPTYVEDLVAPGEDGYLYDVFCYPKNEDNGISKSFDDGTMHQGVKRQDTASYLIKADVPTDIKAAEKYSIVDTYDSNLTLLAASVKVYGVVANDPSGAAKVELTEGVDYALVPNPGSQMLTINFLKQSTGFETLDLYRWVWVNLDVTLNADAPLGTAIDNNAELQYRNRWYSETSHESTRPAETPRLHTGGVKIFKHDSVVATQALASARFALVEKTSDNYSADFTSNGYLTLANGADYIATSGADGILEFVGVPYGASDTANATAFTDYWLVEIQAPDGYRLPGGAPKVIRIDKDSYDGTVGTYKYDVPNVKGFNFPLTGGMGTLLFIAVGFALLGISYFLFKASKKKKEEPAVA